MGITRYYLFVDLRKVLNSLPDFNEYKLWISIAIHDVTNSRIICLTKTEGLLQ